MGTILLDHPWISFGLLYVGGWFIAFIYARPHRCPPTRDGSPGGPTATEKARAKAAE